MNKKIKQRINQLNNGEVPDGYIKTEFGVFPCDWDSCDCQKLFEIIDGDRGKNYPKENELKESGFCLFLNANNVTKNGFCFDDKQFISKIKDNALKKGKLKRNDIVVTTRGTVGNFALYGDNICYENLRINSGVAILRSRKQMNLFYAYQTLKSFIIDNYVKKISFGSAQPQLTISLLNKMPIVIPNKTEQAKIAEILMKWDEAIELHEQLIEKLKKYKTIFLQKMFPQKGQNVPKWRFKGFTEAWEQCKLGDIGKTFMGLAGKSSSDFGHGEGRFVTYMNVFTNAIANPNMVEPIEIDPKQSPVKYGDVFFTTSSETPDEVGMSSIWLKNTPNTYLNSFCFGFRPQIKLDSVCFAYALRSDSFRKKIVLLAQGISRYNITKTKVMELELALPSFIEQKKIGEYFLNLDNLITLHQSKAESLKNNARQCNNICLRV